MTPMRFILARITSVPFNSGNLDAVIFSLLQTSAEESSGLILVVDAASEIRQIRNAVENVGKIIGNRTETAYFLATRLLVNSVRKNGGKPLSLRSDDGSIMSLGAKPDLDLAAVTSLAEAGITIIVEPPIAELPSEVNRNTDLVLDLLSNRLKTSVLVR